MRKQSSPSGAPAPVESRGPAETLRAAEAGAGPAVDGPFVEVAWGTWVRASAVLAVQPYTDGDRFDGDPVAGAGTQPFAGVVVAGGSSDPVWWRSPHAPGPLRAALRRAELAEDARRLATLTRRLATLTRRLRGAARPDGGH
jgi:hypothetical protein